MNNPGRISQTPEIGTKTGYYGALAASYDKHRFNGTLGRLKNWRDQHLVRRAVQHAGPIHRVLDVPCGTGRLVRSLARHIPYLVGADVSRDMINLSRQHPKVTEPSVGHLEYVQCDAKYLPFHSNSFDLVLSGRFLHHLYHWPPAERIQVIQEFARVSRRWVLGDFNIQYGLKSYMNKVRSVLRRRELKSRRMTAGEVFGELNDAGLKVEQVYPISWITSEKWYILCRK
jgi:ubiquinone/menaquinone biosynthesis C-methylase UbiE